jgi:hypothetical protein
MALVEMRPMHKAIYFLLIVALMYVENRAIDNDRAGFAREQAQAREREEQSRKRDEETFAAIGNGINTAIANGQAQFNATLGTEKNNLAQTLGGLKETVNAATGGDGFCYVILVPPNYYGSGDRVFASVVSQGKYPLTNINAMVTDDDMMIQHLNEASKDPEHSAESFARVTELGQEWIHIGDLPPRFSEMISFRAATVTGDSRMLTLRFSANNGNWAEKIALRRVNGQWLRLIRVWRSDCSSKTTVCQDKKILENVDPGFPPDVNTETPSRLSASPPH